MCGNISVDMGCTLTGKYENVQHSVAATEQDTTQLVPIFPPLPICDIFCASISLCIFPRPAAFMKNLVPGGVIAMTENVIKVI